MEENMEDTRRRRPGRKIVGVLGFLILLALAAFVFFRFYYVFGEGQKAGQLNHFIYKGYVFKTYEGRLIMAGYNSSSDAGSNTIQSNKFEFSVVDKSVADELMNYAGKNVRLHYKEYLHTLPWRGMSKYVVDSVCWVEETMSTPNEVPVILSE